MKRLRYLVVISSLLLPVYAWIFWLGYYYVKLPIILTLKHKLIIVLLFIIAPPIAFPLFIGSYIRKCVGVRV